MLNVHNQRTIVRDMRTNDLASTLFNKTRFTVLSELVMNEKPLHLREIARRGGISVSGARAELNKLKAAGIVESERSGNQILFRINPECPLYPEIRMIVIKTCGLADEIRKRLNNISAIKFAYIFGSFASGEFDSESDVDIMVVGKVDPEKAMGKLIEYEKTIGREINVKVYSPDEYSEQLKIKDSFINQIHNSPRIELIGGANDS